MHATVLHAKQHFGMTLNLAQSARHYNVNHSHFLFGSTMPCKFIHFGGDTTAANMLDASPLEFKIEQFAWQCKLGYEGEWEKGKYLFWVDGTLATDLPEAPPIQKENIPTVCQSDNLVINGEVTKRTTF